MLELRNVTAGYGRTKVLQDVTIEIPTGGAAAVMGHNGAGKTTLIATICGLASPTSGTIRVGGYDIKTDYRAARKLIGLVPQEISLEPFDFSCEIVELGIR